MKLYLILYGLVVLVPGHKQGDWTLLLVDTNNVHYENGGHAHPHYPEVGFKGVYQHPDYKAKKYQKIVWGFMGETMTVSTTGAATSKVDFWDKSKTRIVFYSDVLGSQEAARVNPGCLGDAPWRDCVVNGKPVLAGRLRLSNVVAIRAVDLETSLSDLPLLPWEDTPVAYWVVRPRVNRDGSWPKGARGFFSNGLLIAIDGAAGDVQVFGDPAEQDSFKLTPLGDPDACGEYADRIDESWLGTDCYVMTVTNMTTRQLDENHVSDVDRTDHTELAHYLLKDRTQPYFGERLQIFLHDLLAGNGAGGHCVGGVMVHP